MNSKDRVAIMLAMSVGIFVLLSLVAVFILSWNGRDLSDQWGALFALVTAILGALAGWLGGTAYAESESSTGNVERSESHDDAGDLE